MAPVQLEVVADKGSNGLAEGPCSVSVRTLIFDVSHRRGIDVKASVDALDFTTYYRGCEPWPERS